MSRIVVGVDGSPGSEAALDWAAQETRLRGSSLLVLHAFRLPLAYAGTHADPASVEPELTRQSQAVLRTALDRVAAQAGNGEVEGRLAGDQGAADALIQASADADLLVVGARGRGGFHGLHLGSVPIQCVHHAACPVVVVRGAPSRAT